MSEKDFNQFVREGKAVIANCNFGYMIRIEELEDGRAKIECPINGHEIRGPAEADHVRKAIDGWSKRLAEYDALTPDS
ncbi:MAG: hypothetical protein NXI02_30565 [Rhodobacteraceae bacterium]|nr:hypothetical protein [Paracoccaceae bacterium]